MKLKFRFSLNRFVVRCTDCKYLKTQRYRSQSQCSKRDMSHFDVDIAMNCGFFRYRKNRPYYKHI